MAYTIEKITMPQIWVARMKVTLPEYSQELYRKAMDSLVKELDRMGVEIVEPKYAYTITRETDSQIEIIDLELHVAVKNPGVETDMLKFLELADQEEIIRIKADSFADVHTGIAEWMHENDYMADGELRRLISNKIDYVYDCPIKESED